MKASGYSTARQDRSPLWWFPVDAQAWLDDDRIMELKARQVSWLVFLRLEAWKREGRLPADMRKLKRLARVTAEDSKRFDIEFPQMLARSSQT